MSDTHEAVLDTHETVLDTVSRVRYNVEEDAARESERERERATLRRCPRERERESEKERYRERGRERERERENERERANERKRERETEREGMLGTLPTLSRHTSHGFGTAASEEELERAQGRLPESQGHNPALTVVHVPYSLDSGARLFTLNISCAYRRVL